MLSGTASLASIPNQSVPAQQGLTLPLDGTVNGNTDPQTFTVTSSNPDVVATIASGEFWTLNVTYTDPTNPANDFSGPLTFQLFSNSNLTPNTASMIEQFTNDQYYNDTGMYHHPNLERLPGHVRLHHPGRGAEFRRDREQRTTRDPVRQ